ncbi:DNA polymerase-3 subunit alpha [Lachnospiraceae bacterium XBB2008]|nr:DNA polymerase-3 subunit alpha [Lachnospiraceae bacterium XBB2008]
MAFVHLHAHTAYSLLDASNKINEYVKRVKELGMDACAITDHGNMFGVIDFYRACQKEGINPVIGCEVYVAPDSRFSRESTYSDDRYYHLVLLAENNTGYQNLIKIVSRGYTEGYYYKPRIDLELLRENHEGLIGLSACLAGEIPRAIMRGLQSEADAAALRLRDILGEGNFFLEMQDHGIPEQTTVNMALMDMSRRLGIELVVTNDVHYTYANDAEPHDILLCLQTGKKLSDEDRMRYVGGQYYVKSENEMLQKFPYASEAVGNTARIAARCHVEIEFGNYKLPHYEVPEGFTSKSYLIKLCEDGLARRYPDAGPEIRQRLEYELGVIESMGFVDYFLIVWDYINYCREHDIPVGPGRGSAAGSIVSYCLRITDIDPIRYDLLFERFLNPGRVTMPDIDVDFADDRREAVIEYVSERYGRDHVVQIGTFGTMAARGVIRDVARVMDLPYSFASDLAKMVPQELGITLEKAIKMNPDLGKMYNSDDQVHHLLDMCMRLEGLPRNTSTHAAGVVICPDSAEKFVPLACRGDGPVNTQFTKDTVEELGLLKMDFLGLRTLTVIRDACDMIEANYGTHIDIDKIDYNDPKVLELIGSGECEGIFQLESAGMKNFMKELKPGSLEDVIAGISLYRPGPMDFIPQYIEGKNHPDQVTYITPELEPILSATYGCIVYQEQVMQIVRDLAGYTMGDSDNIRRAMSKKKRYVIDENKEYFVHGNEELNIPGCVAKGIPEEAAYEIWARMETFAEYAFNKSHAACYALVSMQTAYLKCYYPAEFMAALLTSVISRSDKVAQYIMTCRGMGIEILPPDINEGGIGFVAKDGNIRYTLTAIKSVGQTVIQRIIDERTLRGPYRNFKDFLMRVGETGELNKRVVENLIKAGALDSFEANRRQMLMIYDGLMDSVHKDRKKNAAGQMTLFDTMGGNDPKLLGIKLPPVPEMPKEELLQYEKEVLGVYISGHPIQEYQDLWETHKTNTTADFKVRTVTAEDEAEGGEVLLDINFEPVGGEEEGTVPEERLHGGQIVTIGGIISECKTKFTRNDKIMAFVTLEDMLGSVEVIVFPKTYEQYRDFLRENEMVFITGRVDEEVDRDMKLLCEKIERFSDKPSVLWIRFKNQQDADASSADMDAILNNSDGRSIVKLYLNEEKKIITLPLSMSVGIDRGLLDALYDRFGRENVEVTYPKK